MFRGNFLFLYIIYKSRFYNIYFKIDFMIFHISSIRWGDFMGR